MLVNCLLNCLLNVFAICVDDVTVLSVRVIVYCCCNEVCGTLVAVIQESKLTLKYRTPNSQNFTTVRKKRDQDQGGGLLTLIHKSINFSRRPDSPDILADPRFGSVDYYSQAGKRRLDHYQRLHTPASSCIGGYNSSDDDDGHPHTGRLQSSPLIVVFELYRYERHYVGEHGDWL